MKKLIVIGAGAHSKVILDILQQMETYEIVGLTDQCGTGAVLEYPILGSDDILSDLHQQGVEYAFIAIGNNKVRNKMAAHVKSLGYKLANAISSCAVVSRYAVIEDGVAIMPGAVINVNAHICTGAIINTNASVDHDCVIGPFVHIAPGCAISGSTNIGACSFLGTGSRVIDRVSVGKNCIVGAGGVVVNNLKDNCEAVGVPAKIIKEL